MAESPYQLLVVKICGIMARSQWRPGHSPGEVQAETGASAAEVTRAAKQAERSTKQGYGDPGPNSVRSELAFFTRLVRAEANAQTPHVDLSDPQFARRLSDDEACAEAYRLLGGTPSGDLQADILAIVTRAQQMFARGDVLAPDALRALWRLASRGAALEWQEHKKGLAKKGSAAR